MSRRVPFQEAATLVKQSLDIIDVIGRHVALRKAGRSYTGLCPFHPEKSPSFNVSAEKQVFNCFGCGAGGDTLSFLMKIDNKTYGEIITELAEAQGLEIIREGRPPGEKDEHDILLKMHTVSQQYFEAQLQFSPTTQAYLAKRHMDTAWQQKFGLGYAPAGWENLVAFLKQELVEVRNNPMLLEKAGLANHRSEGAGFYDRFRNRLMIPIQDDRGRVVAFGGRSLDPADTPKYLNSPETPIYHKQRILYGFAQSRESIRSSRYTILMEGYFDVISAHMAGIPQAVGVCGTALTEGHIKLLQRAGAETLYLCFDSDEAGQTAALRAITLVQHHLLDQGISLKVITLPGEKDPDDFLKLHGAGAFLDCLAQAQDFLTFKFQKALAAEPDLHAAEGRIRATQAITPMLAEIRQPVIRHEYLKRLAEKLQIPEETLLMEVKQYEQKNNLYENKKSYDWRAIFGFQDRYSGRKYKDKPFSRQKPENIAAFRQTLSSKTSLEDKEHLLISYLFLTMESYDWIMNLTQHRRFQSPLAQELIDTLKSFAGQWQQMDTLHQLLMDHFHQTQNQAQLQFLANRMLVLAELQDYYENPERGLKSGNVRAKLKRDIDDIIGRLDDLRDRAELRSLALDGKQYEEQEADQRALDIQLQLREALKTRQKKPFSLPDCKMPLEEEQGV